MGTWWNLQSVGRPVQVIDWRDSSPTCVDEDVKPYSLTHPITYDTQVKMSTCATSDGVCRLGMNVFADLAGSNGDSLVTHRNWSVCSGRVDKDLMPLIRSWNVCIHHHWCTTYCSVQLPEFLLAFSGTVWHTLTADPSHTDVHRQKVVSSVSAFADELHFPPT